MNQSANKIILAATKEHTHTDCWQKNETNEKLFFVRIHSAMKNVKWPASEQKNALRRI